MCNVSSSTETGQTGGAMGGQGANRGMALSSRRKRRDEVRRRAAHPACCNTPPPRRMRLRRPTDRRIARIVRAIRQHPRLSVREVARSAGLSVSSLRRIFKSQTGVGIGAYILAQRLREAAALLRLTELLVKEIARRCGYAHTPSFTRAFTRAFGLSPWLYRGVNPPANE